MSELKCCPFCGGEATLKRDQKDDFVEWSVGCYNRGCACSAHTYCYDNKDDAIRDWNTRTPMANIVEKLEERRIEYELSSENAPDAVSSTYRKGVMRGYEYSRDLVNQEINKEN